MESDRADKKSCIRQSAKSSNFFKKSIDKSSKTVYTNNVRKER